MRRDLHLDVTPLIDVVFQLLLFFMVTTTFVSQATENIVVVTQAVPSINSGEQADSQMGIEAQLPTAGSSGKLGTQDDMRIELRENGEVLVQGRVLELDALADLLNEKAENNPSATVIIQADSAVQHGEFVKVMDLAREAGLTNLGVGTEAKQGAP